MLTTLNESLVTLIVWPSLSCGMHKLNIKCSFLTGPPSLHVMGCFSYFLSMWLTTSKTIFQMTVWQSLNLSHKIEHQLTFFTKINIEKHELLTIFWSKLRFLRGLMLHHNSNIALRFIFSNFIPHNVFTLKHPKCPTSMKLEIAFW